MGRSAVRRSSFRATTVRERTSWRKAYVRLLTRAVRLSLTALSIVEWAALTTVFCAGTASLQAERMSAYVDSRGRVVFSNDPVPVQKPATSPTADSPSSNSSSDTQAHIHSLIEQTAGYHQMDPDLIRAVVQVESNYNPLAVSHRGAMGLMQLIPGTARRFGVANVFDPVQNLDGGTRYLKYLLEMFDGDLELSLAAYNAGENAVARRRSVPPIAETRNYIRKINAIYPLRRPRNGTNGSFRASTVPRIVKTMDQKGIVHFTNTDQP